MNDSIQIKEMILSLVELKAHADSDIESYDRLSVLPMDNIELYINIFHNIDLYETLKIQSKKLTIFLTRIRDLNRQLGEPS